MDPDGHVTKVSRWFDSPTGMGCSGPGPLSPATQVSSSTPHSGPWDRSHCCLSSGIDVRTHLQHYETLRVSRLRTFQRQGAEGIFNRDLPRREEGHLLDTQSDWEGEMGLDTGQ